ESTVTFELDEVLRGVDSRVVAMNDEVEGQLRVDPTDLGATELGTIVIGAQTFETDSSNRDRAIRGPILDAGTFPRITFEPTSIDGLEGDVSVGEQVEFSVTGDLTIRDVTQEVTFDVTATQTAEDRIEGRAMSTVSREAFGLTIPSVASVANVSDEVDVAIDFVATPA
ncbi:MAG: YceI family protein, partial [Acidimicrobiia bacterium]|nr:YceI family protein [Acidimicrobiia bacterium]